MRIFTRLILKSLKSHVTFFLILSLVCCLPLRVYSTSIAPEEIYDLVISGGTVIDPESKLEAVRNIGVSGGVIKAISTSPLHGRAEINARGLIVSPGFIDLHQHGQDQENYLFKAMDGVTTALELEVGTADVDRWYASREGRSQINYGVSVGHLPARMVVMHDPGTFLPRGDAARLSATDEQIAEMKTIIERGLRRGALAVGFGIQYIPNASHWEILEMFRVASRYHASCHVHMRNAGVKEPASSVQALEEVISASAVTGAPLHVVHIQSTGGPATPKLLTIIGEARARGLDVTTECYPYVAGMTDIKSAIFDEGWQETFNISYQDLQWAATGERLTKESFERYRKTGGYVAIFSNTDAIVDDAIANPITMIASDGILENGKGHPRTAGTYTRVLGHYVRERKTLTLMEALGKMTIMPARRLESRVPAMKNKGRVRIGADADLTIFDLARVTDKSTYQEPAKFSEGIKYVLVNGAMLVKDGQTQRDVFPGRAIRAPLQP